MKIIFTVLISRKNYFSDVFISRKIDFQVKLITVTEATVYPLVILGDFKAVLIPGTILGIPETEIVLRQQRVIEVMDQETTEVVGLDVAEEEVVGVAALAKTPLTTLVIGEMISLKLMTGIMR